jgi:hypothetical protein
MINLLRSLRRDTVGAVMVEFALVLTLTLLLTGGILEFLFAFWQWNAATKAVERGARIAAVSDPIPSNLKTVWGNRPIPSGSSPGDRYPVNAFTITCTGSGSTAGTTAATCTTPAGWTPALTGSGANLRTIVYGRASTSCTDATNAYNPGMCDILPKITPANVIVTYSATGLGFYGNPGGPTPTVTVALTNMQYDYFFLRALSNIAFSVLPAIRATVTGEDLSISAP